MKILMVCLGNICRSPLAEGIMQSLINKKKLMWQVDSAGTSGWHEGNPPHRGSIMIAKKSEIDITQQRSRPFLKEDFERFDHILVMDSQNYQDVIKEAKTDQERSKVEIFLNYAHPNSNMGVPDPYYTGNFEEVYDLLFLACQNFVDQHSNNL